MATALLSSMKLMWWWLLLTIIFSTFWRVSKSGSPSILCKVDVEICGRSESDEEVTDIGKT
jgi:hypothetical protein